MTDVAHPPRAANLHRALLPPGWPRPKGYANGVLATGRMAFLGGQIGWDEHGVFAEGLVAQTRKALENICAVLAAADAGPETLVRLTWFILDVEDYLAQSKAIGAVYRETIGAHYPAMSVVQVTRLVEGQALIEIEATAVLP